MINGHGMNLLDGNGRAHLQGQSDTDATAFDPAVRAEVRRRRTFAIISHPDAGKTTLTEKLLLYAGCLDVAGMVRGRRNQRAVTSDWMALERQRGISITSTALSVDYQGVRVNLLDTPGHEDFSEDTYRTLMAADSAVMVLDATKGVEPQTEKLFQVCARRGIPILTFVNKLDRPGGDPLGILSEIERVLGIAASPLNWPVGLGRDFRGLCDRETREVTLFDPDARGSLVVPTTTCRLDDPHDTLLSASDREQLQGDLDLLDVAGAPFDHDRFLQGQVTPVFFGSALTNYGVEAFFDAFLRLGPPPGARRAEGGAVPVDRPEFAGFIFKLQANMDPKHRDRVAFLRVCSGRFERDMEVTNARTGTKLRLARSHRLFAQGRETTDEAFPGDVVGLNSTGDLRLGDTLYAGPPVCYEPLPEFPPECFARLDCADTGRRKQFDRGLFQLVEEGAVRVLVSTRPGVRELYLAAVGTLQFDVVQARLESEYGVPTRLVPMEPKLARRVDGDAGALKSLWLPRASIPTSDRDGRPVILFSTSFELESCRKNNPELHFEPLS
jgi:peptide chain release factor 3